SDVCSSYLSSKAILCFPVICFILHASFSWFLLIFVTAGIVSDRCWKSMHDAFKKIYMALFENPERSRCIFLPFYEIIIPHEEATSMSDTLYIQTDKNMKVTKE